MNQAPSGLSIRGSGRGYFAFTEEVATAPQQGATDTTHCGATVRNCGATDTSPRVRVRAKTKRLRLSLNLLRGEGIRAKTRLRDYI